MLKQRVTKIKQLFATRFFREGTMLQIGSFLNTGLSTLASILLVRTLGADEYGKYVIVIASIGLISWVTDPGLDIGALTRLAPQAASQERMAIEESLAIYVRASLIFLVGIGFAVFPFVPLLMDQYFHAPALVIPVLLWIMGNMTQVATRMIVLVLQAFRFSCSLVWFESLSTLVSNLFRIVGVVMGFGVVGVATGYVVGGIVTAVIALYWYRATRKYTPSLPSIRHLVTRVRRVSISAFVKQGLVIMFDRRLSGLLPMLPVFFLGRYATLQQVGYYELAFGVATTGFLLVSGFSRLIQIQLPRSFAQGYVVLRKHYLQSALGTGLLSSVILGAIGLSASWLVPFVYGAEFKPAVPLVWACIIGLIPVGFMTGNGSMYRLLPRGLSISICMTIGQLVVGVAILWIGRLFMQPLTAVLAMLIMWGWVGFVLHGIILQILLARKINAEKKLPV
jgi:PST family polysaccharide transporter